MRIVKNAMRAGKKEGTGLKCRMFMLKRYTRVIILGRLLCRIVRKRLTTIDGLVQNWLK